MKLPIFFVDAFTEKPFKGNQAAVCVLSETISDKLMQSIAKEIGFSETVFALPVELEKNIYNLRWFTPQTEVPLCGHGTLAASKILFSFYTNTAKITYKTLSGILSAINEGYFISLDFPLGSPKKDTNLNKLKLCEALGIEEFVNIAGCQITSNILIEMRDEESVKQISPDFSLLKNMDITPYSGLIITARSSDKYDFVSRYFTPWEGINEDPVTGSAHCVLAAYWQNRLNKTNFHAKQISERSGELFIKIENNRLNISGSAYITLQGEFYCE